MYDYEALKSILVSMVEESIQTLILLEEGDDPLKVKKVLDVMEKCQVSLYWMEIYEKASNELKPYLEPILNYYLVGLRKTLAASQK